MGGEEATIGLTQWDPNHLFWYILILSFLLLTHPVKDYRRKVYLKTQQDSEQTAVDLAILEVRGRSRGRLEREPRTERSERSIDRALRDFPRWGAAEVGRAGTINGSGKGENE